MTTIITWFQQGRLVSIPTGISLGLYDDSYAEVVDHILSGGIYVSIT